MAQLAGSTTTTTIAPIMAAAARIPEILGPHDADHIYPDISWWVDPLAQDNSETVRWIQELSMDELDALLMSYAVPKIENEDVGYGEPAPFEYDQVEAEGQMIGAVARVTFRALHTGGLDLARVLLATETRLKKRIARDQSIIALTATNVTDLSGEAMTRQLYGRTLAKFRNLQPNGTVGCVMTPGQIELLRTDLRTDASSITIGDTRITDLLESPGVFVGTLEGVPIFRNHYQQPFDAANDFGYFLTWGDGGALGIGNYFATDQPEKGIARGFKYDTDEDKDKDFTLIWVKALLAHAITDQSNILGFASKKLSLAA